MSRWLAVALLLAIFPTFSHSQEAPPQQGVTHEVVKGETLWELADRYLGNPFRWPLIHEANKEQISDPDLIEPGQTLIIPAVGREVAQVQGVVLVEGGVPQEQPPAVSEVVAPASPGSRAGGRTVFYSTPSVRNRLEGADPGGDAGDTAEVWRSREFAVPYGFVYSAEWREAQGTDTEVVGVLEVGPWAADEGMASGIARRGEAVSIKSKEPNDLGVGDLLQSFRVLREARGLGVVYEPTGILVVTEVGEGGISARVSSEYARIRMGDRVRPAPDYRPRMGVFPSPVRSDVSAVIVGFSEERPMQGLGARAFLNLRAEENVMIGDLFRAYVEDEGPEFGMEAARLQVVLVQGDEITARVVGLTRPGLKVGNRLRLTGKMR